MFSNSITKLSENKGLISLLILLSFAVIYIFLIQLIWNQVIVKKFPSANIQKLSFVDSLALAVFFSLLTGGSGFIQI